MKVINVLGGPGVSKSTTAAMVFAQMKQNLFDVELVTEYAKELVWDERNNVFPDQLYILAKQNRSQMRLFGKVGYAITDSPLILSIAYEPDNYYPNFKQIVLDVWNKYDNIVYVLERDLPYSTVGRYHTEKQAHDVDISIIKLLDTYNIKYKTFKASRAYIDIAHDVMTKYPK